MLKVVLEMCIKYKSHFKFKIKNVTLNNYKNKTNIFNIFFRLCNIFGAPFIPQKYYFAKIYFTKKKQYFLFILFLFAQNQFY